MENIRPSDIFIWGQEDLNRELNIKLSASFICFFNSTKNT